MISVTTKNNHINNLYKELSILVSMYGLSFMIREGQKKKFFEYLLPHTNPSALDRKMRDIEAERPVLKTKFDQVKVIHHNNLNTLTPQAFFDPKNNRAILKQNVHVLDNDIIAEDFIPGIKAYNLYVPYEAIGKTLEKNYDKVLHLHSATHFFNHIENTRKQQQKLPIFEIFLNVFPNDFQIAVFKNEQLLAYNHFEYSNDEDFLYFLFFVFETLDIKDHQSHIYLFGTDDTNEIVINLKDFTDNLSVTPPENPSQIYNFF